MAGACTSQIHRIDTGSATPPETDRQTDSISEAPLLPQNSTAQVAGMAEAPLSTIRAFFLFYLVWLRQLSCFHPFSCNNAWLM